MARNKNTEGQGSAHRDVLQEKGKTGVPNENEADNEQHDDDADDDDNDDNVALMLEEEMLFLWDAK